MSFDSYSEPEISPPLADQPYVAESAPRQTPTLMEAVAFFALAAFLLLVIQAVGAVVALRLHLFGKVTLVKLAMLPRFTVPMMALSYAVTLLAAALLFRRVWGQRFLDGIHWNFDQVKRHWKWLPILGVAMGAGIQLASSYFPLPKDLPVDAFFRNAADAWMVALFGVFFAPIAEEIAFRGFLFPGLRRWTGSLLAAILTSVPFVMLHAQQVGHAWGPLAMVFIVSTVLAGIRDRTDSVAASALVHACYNFSIFAVIFYASGGFMHLDRLKD